MNYSKSLKLSSLTPISSPNYLPYEGWMKGLSNSCNFRNSTVRFRHSLLRGVTTTLCSVPPGRCGESCVKIRNWPAAHAHLNVAITLTYGLLVIFVESNQQSSLEFCFTVTQPQ
ncbi:hypothetical protein J6590_069893 [Homalodisca vitripennis]|nr:hypothetical protein J6590_069893 [Homalodisca vitripennis]